MDRVEKIAEEILFPAAVEIDRAPVVPGRYLDELAAAGLYDLPADPVEAARVVETLGGASLVTTFVWIQHHSPVRALAAAGGALAVGVAARCARLLGSARLVADVAEARQALLRSDPHTVVDARAAASLLAVRAATALVAAGGGRSVEAGSHAARLMREATFLLVFGQNPAIRSAQLERLKALD